MSEILSANDANFEDLLNRDQAVLVDFWAPTCAPCRMMEPHLKEIASTFGSRVRVLKVNVNESPRISSRYSVRTLPTLLFFRNGQVIRQILGAVKARQIEQTLHEVIS